MDKSHRYESEGLSTTEQVNRVNALPGSVETAAILCGHWLRKEMESIGSLYQGLNSDSCDSCAATPDQSPLTPFPVVPGFVPFLGFSALANFTLQQPQMYPLLFCGMASPHAKVQLPPESLDQPPVFVNARQYHRILKRRMTRRSQNWQVRKARSKSYIHESRHRHACNRVRGPSGMFLPKQRPSFNSADKQMKTDETDSGATPE